MTRRVLAMMLVAVVTGCSGHHLTGYDLGASAGQTLYDGDGAKSSTFAGVSVKAHFDVQR